MSEIDQMKLDMVTKLASLLMEEQPELTMEQALSIVRRWSKHYLSCSIQIHTNACWRIIPHFITKVPDMYSPSFKRSCRQAKLDKYRPLSKTLNPEQSIGHI